jgi:hypothetical protein|tara:strand:+ start:1027 stop:1218 length:192 start_codon:yes stop_codon:yes gene_type:complete
MIITSAEYIKDTITLKDSSQQTVTLMIKATIDGIEMFVPLNSENRHYAAILEWAEIEGNNITG